MNAFSQSGDNAPKILDLLNFNLDLNPKPKRSDFRDDKSGGAEYNEALKKWEI